MNAQHGARPHLRARFQLYILLGMSTVAAWIIGLLLWPFLPAIGTSAVIAVLIWPIYDAAARRIPNRNLTALLGTIAVLLLILVPLAALTLGLIAALPREAGPAAEGATRLLRGEGAIAEWLLVMGGRIGLDPEQLTAGIAEQMRALTSHLLGRTMALISGLGGWIVQAGVALFTIYYLLRDGDALVKALRWLVPLDAEQTERLLHLSREAIRATMLGNIVVAIVQGAIGGIAFWVAGLPGAVLWGLVMGVLSLLPVVGPLFVWLPAVFILAFDGRYGAAVFLAAVGLFLISTIDNVLRSVLISGRAQLHPLAVFFSVLGGLLLFGAVGVLLGPVLFVVALTVLEMGRIALLPDTAAAPREAGIWLFGLRDEDADMNSSGRIQ